ncbi:hypothetical protein [Hungatella hathewayi]|uniref:Uncharacterized protein n=1 Tax=Hungatella hathewayi WAL-18680 TaxID=742737 RepID=G5IC41_9FIRM|nr:hypothetical protein [Hungatella hathewayi]EHI60959.1 hypothetical protein HMPREF9473_01024 [ [Hungatella hathewayi WAL-18680]
MALQLQLAAAEDAARIWNMQKIAFQKLLDKYQDFDTSPANEPLGKSERAAGAERAVLLFYQSE